MVAINGVVTFALTNGLEAVVDEADWIFVGSHTWYAQRGHSTFYVHRTSDDLPLHRYLLDAKSGEIVDHRDRNGLNNRRMNLRLCSKSQNRMNARKPEGCSSRFKGVTWCKKKRKWNAQIMINKKRKGLGYYTIEEMAAHAYDRAARELFGEFARTNF